VIPKTAPTARRNSWFS